MIVAVDDTRRISRLTFSHLFKSRVTIGNAVLEMKRCPSLRAIQDDGVWLGAPPSDRPYRQTKRRCR